MFAVRCADGRLNDYDMPKKESGIDGCAERSSAPRLPLTQRCIAICYKMAHKASDGFTRLVLDAQCSFVNGQT